MFLIRCALGRRGQLYIARLEVVGRKWVRVDVVLINTEGGEPRKRWTRKHPTHKHTMIGTGDSALTDMAAFFSIRGRPARA